MDFEVRVIERPPLRVGPLLFRRGILGPPLEVGRTTTLHVDVDPETGEESGTYVRLGENGSINVGFFWDYHLMNPERTVQANTKSIQEEPSLRGRLAVVSRPDILRVRELP